MDYSTTTLMAVMERMRSLNPFWLSFFTRQINFTTEKIAFDRVSKDYRRLAPFVAPNVQGRVFRKEGYDSIEFKPAYVKPKSVIDPNTDIVRQPGEALGTGSLTPEQRLNAVVAEELKQHDTRLTNRNEWLAAQAVINGEVTIAGEDYPAVTVNFRRHADLTATLSGGSKWDANTSDPMADIKMMKLRVNSLSGTKLTRLVFGAEAWELFSNRVDLKAMMDRNFGGLNTEVTRMYDGYEGQEYLGRISGLNGAGLIECWLDTSKYVDENNAEQYFLPQDRVVGVGAIEGVRCFGAIKDVMELRAVERFTKSWVQEDPSVRYLLTQSAPLMVPARPNASFSMKVK